MVFMMRTIALAKLILGLYFLYKGDKSGAYGVFLFAICLYPMSLYYQRIMTLDKEEKERRQEMQ